MSVQVEFEGELSDLAWMRSFFWILQEIDLRKTQNRKRKREHGETYDLTVSIIGKTGYGKSTTLNKFFGKEIFATSTTTSCTKKAQSLEFKINNNHYLSFIDLPGIGESKSADQGYLTQYREIIKKTDVIIYILRADTRDYAIDIDLLKDLSKIENLDVKLILALNFCDKIEPISRQNSHTPTNEQIDNINKKIKHIESTFPKPRAIIPYCAATDWNLCDLEFEIVSALRKVNDLTILGGETMETKLLDMHETLKRISKAFGV